MQIDLTPYKNLNICVAVSGGRDSMALLHYLLNHAKDFNISVCAVNFDHRMRGETSARDSAFVADYCKKRGVPLRFYEWSDPAPKTEASARKWRLSKYAEVVRRQVDGGEVWAGADAVATAHHMDDNAETVLFNLSRGSGLSGLAGIRDEKISAQKPFLLIRPLVGCTRAEIDGYIAENAVPYVDDETNFCDDYTRNKLRLKVLPELNRAVNGATEAIFRFSRIAAEDEEFFARVISERGIVKRTPLGYLISRCDEKPLFKRAALNFLCENGVRDYTYSHLETLFSLQFSGAHKKFKFCGCTAFNEGGHIALCLDGAVAPCAAAILPPKPLFGRYCLEGQTVIFGREGEDLGQYGHISPKILRFDLAKLPEGCVLRFMRAGDKFKKFGGGTKSLGDYFTDLKIPARVRCRVPVLADGARVLMVCGVEISDDIKSDDGTKISAVCAAENYRLI